MSATSQVSEVVEQYLDAFYRGDFESPGTLLADDLSFKGAFVEVDGADQFLASAEGLRRIVKGHRTIRQWHDGEELSTLYEMKLETPAGKGSVLVSEWNTVRGSKIASATLVFDTAEFWKLVPQAGSARAAVNLGGVNTGETGVHPPNRPASWSSS